MWGAPEAGFTAGLPIFNWAMLVVIGVPAMVVAAFAEGGTVDRGASWRIAGMVVWVAAVIMLMWPTSFMHFGGFCLDPGDVFEVRWPSRIAGLLLALGLVAGGGFGAVAVERWQRSRQRRAVAWVSPQE